jgi:hypothetical protein
MLRPRKQIEGLNRPRKEFEQKVLPVLFYLGVIEKNLGSMSHLADPSRHSK